MAANEEPASMDVPIKKDPMEDVDQEILSKHLPNKPEDGLVATNESCTNNAAVEICTRDTARIEVRVK